MRKTVNHITEKLFAMQEREYKTFQCKLMPTVSVESVIGIRTPHLRKLAKELFGTPEGDAFLSVLPHKYYEENNLHAFMIEQIKEYDQCVAALDRFLPFVNNWATCDSMRPVCFAKNTAELITDINRWLDSEQTYTVRFGMCALMNHYLGENFSESYLKRVADVDSDEYYVNMMKAWFFATALAKQYEATLPYLEQNKLSVWVHNKTIQKAIESFLISEDHKMHLRSLRR